MNAQPTPSPSNPIDDAPWFMKYLVRFIGIVASIIALALGLWHCLLSVLSPICLLSGILQMLIGVFVLLVEAPCFCPFLDFAQVPGQFVDRRPLWIKAVLYMLLALLPLFLCIGLNSFFGSGLIFVTGTLYGAMAIGKKAPLEQMKARTTSTFDLIPSPSSKQPLPDGDDAILP